MRTLLVFRVLIRQLFRFSYIVPPRWVFDPRDAPDPSRRSFAALPFATWPRADIIHAPSKGPLRRPFAAPLRIATVGERCAQVKSALEKWKDKALPISDAVFKVLHAEQVEHLRFEPDTQQIVVVSDRDLNSLLRMLGPMHRPGERLPRLVICARSEWLSPYLNTSCLPNGIALLFVPSMDAPPFVCELLNRIGDGFTLERSVLTVADESMKGTRTAAMLILDDAANHALRFEDLDDMARIDAELSGRVLPSQREFESPSEVNSYTGRAGFVRLGEFMAANSPLASPEPVGSKERTVEINVLRGVFWAGHTRLLPKHSTLLADADYFLLVHIGRLLPSGLVDMKAPRDTYADSKGGQLLDVVLQEKGFELRTERSHHLYLPPTGASEPVMIGIRAPQKTGSAELRVSIYLRNQVVQTVLIQAEIANQEYRLMAADRGVVGRLEFTQTDGFNDLVALPERALTISVNRDDGATHTLMVKGDEGARPFSVPESLISRGLEKYRDLLEKATSEDGKKPRFPGDGRPNPSETNTYLSLLADLGADLYDGCFYDESKDVILAPLRDTGDRIISVVRHDPRFAFPWQIFYDFQLPIRLIGITPKVCLGITEAGLPCGHTSKDKVYCVRGFWGYRHQIEEMIGAAAPTIGAQAGTDVRRRITTIECAESSPFLGYLVSTEDDYTQDLVAQLGREFKKAAIALEPGDQFLDKISRDDIRPAVVMVLGHLEQTGKSGPVGPRIVLKSLNNEPSAWLVGRELSNRFRSAPWRQPNAIVMLMACESAATSAETLYDFVIAFHRARAAAIVGVECRAFSGLLSQFGADVTVALSKGAFLGQAMLDFRRKMLHLGNPLAFIFTAIGCADIEIRRTGNIDGQKTSISGSTGTLRFSL